MERRSFLKNITKLGVAASVAPSLFLHYNSNYPLKITAGTNLHIPEDGTIEYDGKDLYLTVKGKRTPLTEYEIDQLDLRKLL